MKRRKERKKPFSLMLEPGQKNALEVIANVYGKSVGEVVRLGIDRLIEDQIEKGVIEPKGPAL